MEDRRLGSFIKYSLLAVIFVFLLVVTYVVVMTNANVDVVLYDSLWCVLVAVVLTALIDILFLVKKIDIKRAYEKFFFYCSLFLCGVVTAIMVPAVLDRSLSFYLLEKIAQHGGAVNRNSLTHIFTNDYVKEHRLMDIRLTEQLESGTVTIKDDCIVLSERGRNLARFSRWFRLNMLPSQRLILDEYTDDLVDPFKGIEQSRESSYKCSE